MAVGKSGAVGLENGRLLAGPGNDADLIAIGYRMSFRGLTGHSSRATGGRPTAHRGARAIIPCICGLYPSARYHNDLPAIRCFNC